MDIFYAKKIQNYLDENKLTEILKKMKVFELEGIYKKTTYDRLDLSYNLPEIDDDFFPELSYNKMDDQKFLNKFVMQKCICK